MDKKQGRRDPDGQQGSGHSAGLGLHSCRQPRHKGAHRGAGGSRGKPEQGETTFYILTGYKNVSSFTEQARQDQDGIKEDVSLVLSKIQTSDNKKLNIYPYDHHTALPECCLWQTLCLSVVPNWWSSLLSAAAHQARSTIASLLLPTAKPNLETCEPRAHKSLSFYVAEGFDGKNMLAGPPLSAARGIGAESVALSSNTSRLGSATQPACPRKKNSLQISGRFLCM